MSYSCQQTTPSDSHCVLYTLSFLTVPLLNTRPLIFPKNYALKTFFIIWQQWYECNLFLSAGKCTVVPVHPTNPCEGAKAQLHSFLKSTWKKRCSHSRFGCFPFKINSSCPSHRRLIGHQNWLRRFEKENMLLCDENLNTISRLPNPHHSHCTNWALPASFTLRTHLLISAEERSDLRDRKPIYKNEVRLITMCYIMLCWLLLNWSTNKTCCVDQSDGADWSAYWVVPWSPGIVTSCHI
jgi:hypothetical protein